MSLLGLDGKGILVALIIALLLYFLSRPEYLFGLIVFLMLGNYVSMIRPVTKMKMKKLEKTRSFNNVLSNGIIPILLALFDMPFGIIDRDLAYLGYLSALAAITADKFSSELGIFDKYVYTIIGRRRTVIGRSGGISLYGSLAGAFGSMLISIFGILVFNISIENSILIFIAGIIGNLFDSIAGYFEEEGIGSKEISNVIGALGGSISGILLYYASNSLVLPIPIYYLTLIFLLIFYYIIFSQNMR